MKLNSIYSVAAVLSLACALQSQAATPAVGQPAPLLTFTQLYGAPEGTKTDWPSLKGKVVVLEFWATWCAPCIAEIPHLNEFATSLAASNVQFISVDDEQLGPMMVQAPVPRFSSASGAVDRRRSPQCGHSRVCGDSSRHAADARQRHASEQRRRESCAARKRADGIDHAELCVSH